MRLAAIADVHANAPALEAVLEAVGRLRVERMFCLGDLVGYNADPGECVRRIRAEADVVVAGNHDIDCTRSEAGGGTSSVARYVQEWTHSTLSAQDLSYLGQLPTIAEESGVVAVHGCYLNSHYYTGYVTSTMLEANLRAVAGRESRIALCGHTHVPLYGWLVGGNCQEPTAGDRAMWPRDAEAVLVNPGSVGQPRDGDPRASFAILDLEARSVEIHRIPYDIDRAVMQLRKLGLPTELEARLREGR